jgi:PAS domain S-box-containing protein
MDRTGREPEPTASGPRSGARHLAVLRAIAERTRNGVVVTNRDGEIDWVNAAYTRLSGYTLDELRGVRPGSLLEGPATAPATRAVVRDAVAGRRPFDIELVNYAKGGRQYWVRIEAEPLFDDDGAFDGYLAIESDTTEQRIAEASAAVTVSIGDRLLRCESVEAAAQTVTEELVRMFDVRAAQVWVVEPGAADLRYVAGRRASAEAQAWLDATAASVFRRGTEWVVGVGAPGVAWGTAAPCVRTDFWQADKAGRLSRRSSAARAADIRTVCATPVLGPDGVVAVLEIGGSHAYPGHERLPALLARVAHQLGAFLMQRRNLTLAEQANRELRRQIADRSAQLFAAMTLAGDGAAPVSAPGVGAVINSRYQVEEKLGEGGMGAVFRVVRVDDGTRWAMKVATALRSSQLARLAREAHLLSRIRHPNVVQVVDIDIAAQGFMYIVLELVDGADLHAWRSERTTTIPLATSLSILLQVARGLYKLHSANIAHRDLKPQNILVVADGERLVVKLADFGIARLAGETVVSESTSTEIPLFDDDDAVDEMATTRLPPGVVGRAATSAGGGSTTAHTGLGGGVRPGHAAPAAAVTRATVSHEQAAQRAVVEAVAATAAGAHDDVGGPVVAPPVPAVQPPNTEVPSGAGPLNVTRTGVVVGTMQYMAPEMLTSATASPVEADLFSFGIVAWELVAGRRPFDGPMGAFRFAAEADRDSPTTRLGSGCDELDDLVRRCLVLTPAARPTALETMQQIETIAAQRGIPIRS